MRQYKEFFYHPFYFESVSKWPITRREAVEHQPDHGDFDQSGGDLDEFFEILAHPSLPTDSGESSLDNSTLRYHLEPTGGVAALDDLEPEGTEVGNLPGELVAGIFAINPDQAHPWEATLESLEYQ